MAGSFKASLTASTALVGVLGDPVRHSLSPAMHNAALRELGLDWVYLALPLSSAKLAAGLEGLEAIDCRGLNVTLPHKQAVAKLCRSLGPLAQKVGAVNTLVRLEGGGWHGMNTDVEGFLVPLQQESWQEKQALVLGCGGSCRAVVAALVELGFGRVSVAGRQREALEALAADCGPWAPQLQTLAWGGPRAGLAGSDASPLQPTLQNASLVVNTTPVGMASTKNPASAEQCPLSPAELEALEPSCWVYDLIYTPRPTRLLQAAACRGCPSLDGLEMLVQQGAAALRLWSGLEQIPVAAMRAAALEQLQGSS